MPDNSILLLIGLEVAVVLICLMGLVLWRARSLSKTGSALEAKVIELRQSLKAVRSELKMVRAEATAVQPQADYGELIDAQIGATRNHHLGLNPERDIVLDMAADAPPERRAVSLRHAFLIAEKEAWLASDDGREVDWSVLAAKLDQIIQFYEQPVAPSDAAVFVEADGLEALDLADDLDEVVPDDHSEMSALRDMVESQKRQIANLERFKKLFFDADDKWRKAGKQAEQYRQEILAQSRSLNAGDEFNALMDNYNRVYVEFGSALAVDDEAPRNSVEKDIDQPSVGQMVIANQEEMQRLRNMAVDQHKMILRLRQELEGAHTLEEKDHVIGQLHKQLERHERFLKESDICTKQLENELERVLEENHSLKKKVVEAKSASTAPAQVANTDVEKMAAIIEDFTQQSADMLSALEVLETECNELRSQLKNAETAPSDPAAVDGLKEQLASAQQELLNLQTQHIELEERYLELKTASL